MFKMCCQEKLIMMKKYWKLPTQRRKRQTKRHLILTQQKHQLQRHQKKLHKQQQQHQQKLQQRKQVKPQEQLQWRQNKNSQN